MAGLVEHSGKMVILMDIIDECVCFGDKLLVFRSVVSSNF